MSHQQAPQTQAEALSDVAKYRKLRRDRQRDLTAADFLVGEIIRVRLKFSDGRELYFPATVIDTVYAKLDGRTFDHVMVRLRAPEEAYAKDLPMIETVEDHVFLLDYSRSNYWFWRINTVQWVPD